jgi:hypothetical protein
MFICSIYARVYLTWYKFIQDEFNIDHDKKNILNELYDLINKTFISRCYFTEKIVLVLKTPKKIYFNEKNVLHNVHGPSYSYEGEINYYHVNGREIPKKYVEEPININMLLEERNEDLKAAMVTIIKEREGQEGLLKFLNARVIDEKTITHDSGHIETFKIYHTKEKYSFLQDSEGNFNQPYAFFEEKCPSTGQVYLIDTSAHFKCAIEAAKFHRPSMVGHEIDYNFKFFNN